MKGINNYENGIWVKKSICSPLFSWWTALSLFSYPASKWKASLKNFGLGQILWGKLAWINLLSWFFVPYWYISRSTQNFKCVSPQKYALVELTKIGYFLFFISLIIIIIIIISSHIYAGKLNNNRICSCGISWHYLWPGTQLSLLLYCGHYPWYGFGWRHSVLGQMPPKPSWKAMSDDSEQALETERV